MNELRIAATKSSPEILLSPGGMIRIKGRSIHENTLDFFRPVEDWINNYVLDPADVTCIDMNLEYFNSASAKFMIHLFQKIHQRKRVRGKSQTPPDDPVYRV